jgi:hypothetical protein
MNVNTEVGQKDHGVISDTVNVLLQGLPYPVGNDVLCGPRIYKHVYGYISQSLVYSFPYSKHTHRKCSLSASTLFFP